MVIVVWLGTFGRMENVGMARSISLKSVLGGDVKDIRGYLQRSEDGEIVVKVRLIVMEDGHKLRVVDSDGDPEVVDNNTAYLSQSVQHYLTTSPV